MRSLLVSALAFTLGACGASVTGPGAFSDVPVASVDRPSSALGVTDAGTSGTDGGSPDGAGTVTHDLGNATYDYVVDHFDIDDGADPASTTRPVYGFNLDGLYSSNHVASQHPGDCSHGDYFSAVDPDQDMGTCVAGLAAGGPSCQGGVDNQLPVIAGTVLQLGGALTAEEVLNDQVDRGQVLMLIRVSDVSGPLGPTLDDPSVTVRVYTVVHPAFADCANIQQNGQTYAVDDRSLDTPGDLDSAKFQYSGSIVNGRLRVNAATATAAAPTFSIGLSLMGTSLTANLFQTQLRVDLGADRAANGNMGGYIRQSGLIATLLTIPVFQQHMPAYGALIQGFVDVATGSPAACMGPDATPATEGAVGIGVGFTARPAVIAPATVSAGTPGNCGG